MKHQRPSGFTLIELMIVVAIVAILAAIAYPSYQNSIRKTRRADAQNSLTQLAQFMERRYTENNFYTTASGNNTCPTLPFTESPQDPGSKFYDLTLTACANNTFTLRATAKNGQSGDGILELDSTGAKRWDKDNNGSFAASESTWTQ